MKNPHKIIQGIIIVIFFAVLIGVLIDNSKITGLTIITTNQTFVQSSSIQINATNVTSVKATGTAIEGISTIYFETTNGTLLRIVETQGNTTFTDACTETCNLIASSGNIVVLLRDNATLKLDSISYLTQPILGIVEQIALLPLVNLTNSTTINLSTYFAESTRAPLTFSADVPASVRFALFEDLLFLSARENGVFNATVTATNGAMNISSSFMINVSGQMFDAQTVTINQTNTTTQTITPTFGAQSEPTFGTSTAPYPDITFVAPTPLNNTITRNTSVIINVSITNSSGGSINEFKFNWNGTNYTFYNDSLVLMMNFDNVTGIGENSTKAIDVSKYGNNGTCPTCPTWNLTGKYGGAFSFDGVNDFINLSNNIILDLTATGTMETWINIPASPPAWGTIIAKRTSGGTPGFSYNLDLSATGQNLRGLISNGVATLNIVTGGTTISSNAWHHVVMTWDKTNLTVYLDSVRDGSVAQTINAFTNTFPLEIGIAEDPSPLFYKGSIDEVRIWNRSLSADEVRQNYYSNLNKYSNDSWQFVANQTLSTTNGVSYNFTATTKDVSGNENVTETRFFTIGNNAPTISSVILNSTTGANTTADNLTAYPQGISDLDANTVSVNYDWRLNGSSIAVLNLPMTAPFNNGSRNLTFDFSNFRNIAELSGTSAPVWNASGIYGGSYNFDGINSFINISDSNSLDLNTKFSISVWINANTLRETNNYILTKQSIPTPNDEGYALFINANKTQMWNSNSGGYCQATSTAIINTTQWFHIVGTYDGSNQKIYINGTLNKTNACTINPSNTNVPITIGLDDTRNDGLNGSIDEIQIYNHSLSAEEVFAIYNNSAPRYDRLVSNETRGAGNIWTTVATPIDNLGLNGTGVLSNNLTITAVTITAKGCKPLTNFASNNFSCNATVSTSGLTIRANVTLPNGNLHNMTLLNDNLNYTFSFNGSVVGLYNVSWIANNSVTTSTIATDSFVVNNSAPSITSVLINSTTGANTTADNLTAYPSGVGDINPEQNVTVNYDWRLNGTSIAVLNLPMTAPYNNGSRNLTFDFSSYNNVGIMNETAPTWISSGKYGGTYAFNGNNNAIVVGEIFNATSGSNLTISVWVKIERAANWILGKSFRNSNLGQYSLYTASDKFNFGISTDAGASQSIGFGNTTTANNTWTHLVITHQFGNAASTKTYLNGTLVASTWTGDGNTVYNSCANDATGCRFEVGHWYGTPPGTSDVYWMNGTIDEVQIYNRSLSAEEIFSIYNNSAPRYDLLVKNETGGAGNIWTTVATPIDNLGLNGTGVLSNNLTITAVTITAKGCKPLTNFASNNFSCNATISTTGLTIRANVTLPNGNLHNMTLLNDNLNYTFSFNGSVVGQYNISWIANNSVTTSTIATDSFVVNNSAPSITSVLINSTTGANTTADNLTAYPSGVGDLNPEQNNSVNYDWRLNGSSIAVLNLPMTAPFNNGTLNQTFDFSTAFTKTVLGGSGSLAGTTAPVWNTSGVYGGAYTFDGSNDLINTTKTYGQLGIQQSLTLEAWIDPANAHAPSVPGPMTVIGDANNLILLVANETVVQVGQHTFQTRINASIDISGYYHVIATYSDIRASQSNTIKLYVNGTLRNSSTTTNSALDPLIENVHVGHDTGSGTRTQFNGSIDEVRIYNRSLSAEEIQAIYNNSAPRYDLLVKNETGGAGNIWTTVATPIDNLGLNGTGVLSNNLTITAVTITARGCRPLTNFANNNFSCNATVSTTGLTIRANVTLPNGNLHNMTLLNDNFNYTFSFNGSLVGLYNVSWSANNSVTTSLATDSFTVNNSAPSITSVLINSTTGANTTADNLTAFASGIGDLNPEQNVSVNYDWRLNGSSIAVLNLPMTAPYNNGSRNLTFDFSTNNNVGVLGNGTDGTTQPTWNASGIYGGAYTFNDDSMNLGNNPALNFAAGKGFTFTAWVKTSDTSGQIVSFRDSSNDNPVINLAVGFNGLDTNAGHFLPFLRYDDGSGMVSFSSTTNIANGAWQFIALVYNPSTQKIQAYINSSFVWNATQTATGTITTQNMRAIGAELRWIATSFFLGTTDNEHLNGTIDEVRIYNRSLSAEEIQAIYNNSAPRYDLLVSNETGGAGNNWSIKSTPIDNLGLNGTGIFSNNLTITAVTITARGCKPLTNFASNNFSCNASVSTSGLTVKANVTLPNGNLHNMTLLNDNFNYTFSFNGSVVGQYNISWIANNSVTTSTIATDSFVVNNSAPTISSVILNSTTGANTTADNLTAFASGIGDLNPEQNVSVNYDWRLNGTSIAVLNMPMTAPYNNGSRNLTFDFSTNNNVGVMNESAPTWISNGKYGGAYNFDLISSPIVVSDTDNLDLKDNFTIMAWINGSSFNYGSTLIISKHSSSADTGYVFFEYQNKTILQFGDGGGGWPYSGNLQSNTPLKTNTVYHIAVTRSGTKVNFYLNGSSDGSPTTGGNSIAANTQNLWIGSDVNAPNPATNFNGSIDEVQIYNHSLSAEQIFAIYNNSAPRYDVLVSNETGGAGNNWSVKATPIDNLGLNGTGVLSNNLTITSVTITARGCKPLTNFANNNFSCNATVSTSGLTIRANVTLPNGNLHNMTLLNDNLNYTFSFNGSVVGQYNISWIANNSVTTSTIATDSFVVNNSAPSITSVLINSTTGANTTADNLTAAPSGVGDINPEQNVSVNYDWRLNGTSIAVLNLPMTAPFNNGSRNLTFDFSSFNNVGVLNFSTGAPTWNASGIYGGAYTFDGSDDHINITHTSSLNTTNTTVMAWVQTSTVAAFTGIVDKGWQNSGYLIDINNDDARFAVQNSAGTFYNASGGKISDGRWFLLTGTYDDSNKTIKIYVNSTLKNSTEGIMSTNGLNIIIGGDKASTNPFKGSIDEVHIYNRTLSAEEIFAIYNNSAPRYDLLVSNETGGVGNNWSVKATPIDNLGLNGTGIFSNNLTITAVTITARGCKPLTNFANNNFSCNATVSTTGLTIRANVTSPNGNLHNMTLLNDNLNYTFSFNGSVVGQYNISWIANNSITTSTIATDSFVVNNSAPSITSVLINSTTGGNTTADNLTAFPSGVGDINPEQNVSVNYDWRLNGTSIALLNLPMTAQLFNGTQNVTFDFSTRKHFANWTLAGMPLFNSSGIYGGSYTFDGVDDFIEVPPSPFLNKTENMTACFWVNVEKVPSIFAIQYHGGFSGKYWFSNNSGNWAAASGGGFGSVIGTEINVGQWKFLCSSFNYASLKFYENGTLIGTDLTPGTSGTELMPLDIGAYTFGNSYLKGSIDEYVVYDKILSAEEIFAIYNNSAPRYDRLVSNETGGAGNIWTTVATPIDTLGLNGTGILSNNLTITAVTITARGCRPLTNLANNNFSCNASVSTSGLSVRANVTLPNGNLHNMTLLNDNFNYTFSFNGSVVGQYNISWVANNSVTTSTIATDSFVVNNSPPTISNILLNSTTGGNTTADNLTAFASGIGDLNPEQNVSVNYDWRLNGTSIALLNLPMTAPYNNGSRNLTFDFSNYNNLIMLGNDTVGTKQPIFNSSGKYGGAYTFDGTDDYLDILSISNLNSTPTNYTYAIWVNSDSFAGTPLIFSNHKQGCCGDSMPVSGITSWVNPDGTATFQTRMNNVCCQTLTGNAVLTTNRWFFIVATYNGSLVSLYINGTLDNTLVFSNGKLEVNKNTILGVNGDTLKSTGAYANMLKGSLDEFTIYNRTLSAEEVFAIYNNSAPRYDLLVSNETGSAGNIWTTVATPIDNLGLNGTGMFSNNLTITAVTITARGCKPLTNFANNNFSCNATVSTSGLTIRANVTLPNGNLYNMTLLNDNFNYTFSFNGSVVGQYNISWITNNSMTTSTPATDSFVVNNSPPTISSILLNSTTGANTTADNLTAYSAGIGDLNPEQNVSVNYDWRLNGSSIAVLNLPMTAPYNNGSRNLTFDFSTNNDVGVLGTGTDGTTQPTWNASGIYGGAYTFDGSNDFINLFGSNLNFGTRNFSITMWVNPNTFASEAGLYDSLVLNGVGGRSDAFILVQTATTGKLRIFTNGAYSASTSQSLSLNKWNYMALVNNGGNLSFSINGTIDPVTVSLTTSSTSGGGVIGRYADVASGFFKGSIDELVVYNRTLSAEEIQAIYNNSAPRYDLLVSNETGGAGNIWTTVATPIDNLGLNGTGVLSNNLTITAVTITARGCRPLTSFASNNFSCNATVSTSGLTVRANVTLPNGSFYNMTLLNDNLNYTFSFNGSVVGLYTVNWITNNSITTSITTDSFTVNNSAPSITSVLINSTTGANTTADNLTAFTSGVGDINPEQNVSVNYDWRLNGSSIAVLNLPMTAPFNNGSRNLTFDFSTNNNVGVLGAGSASPIWNSTGKYGGAYSFDGTNDVINISSFNVEKLTISVWVNPRSNTTYKRLITKYQGSGSPAGTIVLDTVSGIGTNGNGLRCLIANLSNTVEGPTVDNQTNVNTWQNFACTFNGSVISVYKNGTLVGNRTTTFSNIPSLTRDWAIGEDTNEGTNPEYFNGSIDEVQIYNRSLSPEQIFAIYNNSAPRYDRLVPEETSIGDNWTVLATPIDNLGLNGTGIRSNDVIIKSVPDIRFVAPTPANGTITINNSAIINVSITNVTNILEYKFNWNGTNYTMYNDSLVLMMNFDNVSGIGENSTKVIDVSKYGNNGSINGATWITNGKHGGAFNFVSANTNTITIPGATSLTGSSAITISAWINRTSATNYGTVLCMANVWSDPYGDYCLQYQDTSDSIYFHIGKASGSYTNLLATTPGNNVWFHAVGTFNGTNMTIYINGVNANSVITTAMSKTAGAALRLGTASGSDYLLNGAIDEVRIYNRSLSADEITQLYRSNLNKYNNNSWQFVTNQTNLTTGNINTYFASVKDFNGNSNITETRTLSVATVNTCARINEPGTYTLNQNLLASGTNCIDLNTQNATINCQGYNITSNPFGVAAFNISVVNNAQLSNITIQNCNIQNFSVGINVSSASNISLFNNNITNVSNGIWLNNIVGSILENNTANATGNLVKGIFLKNSTNNTLIQNNASSQPATGQGNSGIYLLTSNKNILKNNTGKSINSQGITIDDSANNQLTHNTGISQTNSGILIISSTLSVENNTLTNNIGTSNDAEGILLSSITYTNLTNNTATSNNYHAIAITGANNNNIQNNTAKGNISILITDANNNNFTNNTLIGNTGFEINSSNNILITNSSFQNVNWSIKSDLGTNFSLIDNQKITNYTFVNTPKLTITQTGIASLNFFNIINANGTNLSMDVNLTTNRVHVNSSRSLGLNVTANITLFNLNTFRTPIITVDYADTGTQESCTSPKCINLSFSLGTLIFNVSSFTTYRTVLGCGLINESSNLSANTINNGGTCFDFNQSNLVFDCAGYNVTSNPKGIMAFNISIVNNAQLSNITIKNCNIQNFSIGINVSSASNISLFNNNITNVTGGIWLNNTATSVLENNTINSSNGYALYLINSSNNTITKTSATSTTITTQLINGTQNTISNNSLTGKIAIFTQTTKNNNFTNNTLIGDTGFEINSSTNILITNSSFQDNNWSIKTGLGSNVSLIDNQRMTNYTFANAPKTTITKTGIASINFFNIINANGTNLSMDVNLTSNRTHVNSTRSPGLNVNSNITMYNILLTNPVVLADFNDTGIFTTCPLTTCTNLSYTANTFIFNTSHFTTFAVNENISQEPHIDLINPQNATSFTYANRPFNFSWNVTSTNTTLNCDLLINGSINTSLTGVVSGANTSTLVNLSPGKDYTWGVNCTDGTFNNQTLFRIFNVTDTTSPTVALNNPADNYQNHTSDPTNLTFNCSATDDFQLQNISLYITNNQNNTFAINQTTNISGQTNSTTWTLQLRNGTYTWNCLAYDSSNNYAFATNNKSILINFSYPAFDVNITANATNATTLTGDANNISYTITVFNNGTVGDNITSTSTYNLTVQNPSNITTAHLNETTITLLSGTRRNVTLRIGNILPGTFNTTVTAFLSQNFGVNSTTPIITTTILQLGDAVIAATKTGTPNPAESGENLNYTITLNNIGNKTAQNVTVTEDYPAEITFISATPTPTTANNIWLLGNITNQTTHTINITIKKETPTTINITNNANITYINSTGTQIITNTTQTTTINAAKPQNPSGGTAGAPGKVKQKNTTQEQIEALTITPTFVKIKIKQGETKKEIITLTNTGNTQLIAKLDAALGGMIAFSQKEITIEPGTAQTITLLLTAPESKMPDAYISSIIIKAGTQIEQRIPVIIDVIEKSALFDIQVNLPQKPQVIRPDESATADIILYNMGDIKPIDVTLKYSIRDMNNKDIISQEETFAVEEQKEVKKSLKIPHNIAPGYYVFYAKADYGKNQTATSSALMQVIEPAPIVEQPKQISQKTDLTIPAQLPISIFTLIILIGLYIAGRKVANTQAIRKTSIYTILAWVLALNSLSQNQYQTATTIIIVVIFLLLDLITTPTKIKETNFDENKYFNDSKENYAKLTELNSHLNSIDIVSKDMNKQLEQQLKTIEKSIKYTDRKLWGEKIVQNKENKTKIEKIISYNKKLLEYIKNAKEILK